MRYWITALLLFGSFSAFAQDSLPIVPDGTGGSKEKQPVSMVKAKDPFTRKIIDHLQTNQVQELQVFGKSVFIATTSSALGIATYGFVDEPLRNFTISHRTEDTREITRYVEPFGNSSYMIPASAMVYASGLALRYPKVQRLGLLLTSSLLINDFVTNKLKDEFQRRRPDQADHNYYFEGGEGGRHYASFPSAHTSTAFAFATSVAFVYRDYKWVPPVAYAGATLVGLSRIHDNKHWATDVMAGAAVGFITAKATGFMLKQVEDHLAKRKVNLYVSPRVSTATASVNMGLTF